MEESVPTVTVDDLIARGRARTAKFARLSFLAGCLPDGDLDDLLELARVLALVEDPRDRRRVLVYARALAGWDAT